MAHAHEARREQALADIREQVADGSLTIRQMTDEERARYGSARKTARPARSRRGFTR